MPLFISRVIIIVVILLILILFRKFIKRLIFLIILLAIAFFIYGLFSPSGAGKLRDNVKTFPHRMASFFGGEKIEQPLSQQPSTPKEAEKIELPPIQEKKSEEKKSEEKKSDRKAEAFTPKDLSSTRSLSLIKEKLLTTKETPIIPENTENTLSQETSATTTETNSETTTSETNSETTTSDPQKEIQKWSQGLTTKEISETEKLFDLLLQ